MRSLKIPATSMIVVAATLTTSAMMSGECVAGDDQTAIARDRFILPTLLQSPRLHEELKTDAAQRNRIAPIVSALLSDREVKSLRRKLSEAGSAWQDYPYSQEKLSRLKELGEKLTGNQEALRQLAADKLATILSAEQMVRLSEISVQFAIVSSEYFPRDYSQQRYGDFYRALGVSAEQRAKLAMIPNPPLCLPPFRWSREYLDYWIVSSRKILTDEQSRRVQQWMGKPFDLWGLRNSLPTFFYLELESDATSQEAAAEKGRAVADHGMLLNGSFEERKSGAPPKNVETIKAGRDELAGWEVIENSVDWIGPQRWVAPRGKHCLDLDGGIRQTIRTVTGASYKVRFDLAGNPEIEPTIQMLRVFVDDRPHEFTFDSTGKSTHDLGWRTESIVFTANNEHTTLTFFNARPNVHSVGVALDNVVVRRIGKPVTEIEARRRYLQRQVVGLLIEADGLRKAGRIEDARQHEEKSNYRRRQLKDLPENNLSPVPEKRRQPTTKPDRNGGKATVLPALPGPWGETVKGLRCRIAELSLSKQRFTVEIQNQSDETLTVAAAPTTGYAESLLLEWAFFDPGEEPKWEQVLVPQSEPPPTNDVKLAPGKSLFQSSGIVRTSPGSRLKARYARFLETGPLVVVAKAPVEGNGNAAKPRSEPSWSDEVGGLRMRLHLDKKSFAVGEDIPAIVMLKNVRDKPVDYCEHYLPTHDAYPMISFLVVDPAGRQVLVEKAVLASNEWPVLKRHVLEPGATVRQAVKLNSFGLVGGLGPSVFDRPGEYSVRCIYDRAPAVDLYGLVTEEELANFKAPKIILQAPPVTLRIEPESASE